MFSSSDYKFLFLVGFKSRDPACHMAVIFPSFPLQSSTFLIIVIVYSPVFIVIVYSPVFSFLIFSVCSSALAWFYV